MTAAHQQRGVALKSMHLILEVQRPQRAQDVRLSLEGLNGERFTQTFTLTDVSQGAYRRFDLNPGRYVAGRIDLLGPGSISTVEVHSGDGPVHTCVILEYLDGKTAFTPGCPLP